MASIYYSYSDNRRGVLRAVLSSEEGRWFLKAHSAEYAGQQFPTTAPNSEINFAVLRIFEGEGTEEWHVGFYSLNGDMMKIEQALPQHRPLQIDELSLTYRKVLRTRAARA
jgi:hypothetical protein